jgi:hypothetical protein
VWRVRIEGDVELNAAVSASPRRRTRPANYCGVST